MEITADKAELLKILKRNRSKHRKTFEAAVQAYNEKVLGWHRAQVEQLLEKGALREQYAHFRIPEEHTDDYDTVIEMLEMHTGKEFTISFSDFQCFIRDVWSWSAAFAGNTASYVVGVES